jgi:glycosyltransferase involved in cell wall biosynthesis
MTTLRRVVILTEIISPYRIPVFNALARTPGIDLHVIFLAETDATLWQWKIPKEDIQFSYEVLAHWRRRIRGYNVLLNRGVIAALAKAHPNVMVLGGYSYLAMWQAQRWARRRKIPVLLWSESNLSDRRKGRRPVEFLKKSFLRSCGGFIVPGRSARRYLSTFGIPDRVIFTAPNAVDNDFFAASASAARAQAAEARAKLGLPKNYFLFVGRMVPEKGIGILLQAYERLDAPLRKRVGLVMAGDGPGRAQSVEDAGRIWPGKFVFPGFLQREDLAVLYGLAEALVFPTFSDPWGLVVNEAMACGLPVIATDVAGATTDLVRDGWNGRTVSPGDIDGLVSAMRQLAQDREGTQRMARNSLEHIANFTSQTWADGFTRAVTESSLGW